MIFAEKKQINLKFTFEKRKMESKSEVLSALKPGPVILKWINALMRFDAFYAPFQRAFIKCPCHAKSKDAFTFSK